MAVTITLGDIYTSANVAGHVIARTSATYSFDEPDLDDEVVADDQVIGAEFLSMTPGGNVFLVEGAGLYPVERPERFGDFHSDPVAWVVAFFDHDAG